MDRREFIEQVAAWSAGACLAAPIFDVGSVLAAEEPAPERPLLAVAKGKDYAALVEAVLKPL
ncbi:MAG: cytoplasmic protein, partial [Pirellulaceae bacterium]|nr:cytoplasmic protein [Pirellulaceae bacterium]